MRIITLTSCGLVRMKRDHVCIALSKVSVSHGKNFSPTFSKYQDKKCFFGTGMWSVNLLSRLSGSSLGSTILGDVKGNKHWEGVLNR